MEFPRHHSRAHIRQEPAADFPPYLWGRPVTLFERGLRAGIVQQFRVLWKDGFGQFRALGLGRGWSTRTGVHQQIVNVDVDAKLRGGWASHLSVLLSGFRPWPIDGAVITRMLVFERWFHCFLLKMTGRLW